MLLVVDPAIGAVLAAKTVFEGLLADVEEVLHLGFDARQIVRMNVASPKVGIAEIGGGRVAEQPLQIAADKSRGEVVARLEAIDHGGRGGEQPCGTLFGGRLGGFVHKLLNNGRHRAKVGVGPQ